MFRALLLILPLSVWCQCPHSPRKAAPPASAPRHVTLQTAYIYATHSEDDKEYAEAVTSRIRETRKRLRADVSLDNENIHCETTASHPRCADFRLPSFHHFVVEDAVKGAVVYSLEPHLNGADPFRIDAALLDAISRHAGQSVVHLTEEEGKNVVGFVRELSVEEMLEMSGAKARRHPPVVYDAIDISLIQLRNAAGLEKTKGNLVELSNESEMDRILENKYVVVLFWSTSDTASLHAYALFANASLAKFPVPVSIAHVPCHLHSDFCSGLSSRDLRMLVAYRDGIKLATLADIRDIDFYVDWITLVLTGPVRKLEDAEEMKKVKRGNVDGVYRPCVIIGTFPNEDGAEFRHFRIAADKAIGRFAIFYSIREGFGTINAYRSGEHKKKEHFSHDFDPHSIGSFFITSCRPSVIDLTRGFSSYLLRDIRPLLIFVAPSSSSNSSFSSLANSQSANYIFSRIRSEETETESILKGFGIDEEGEVIVLIDKTRIWHRGPISSPEELNEWLISRPKTTPDMALSPYGVHPLRLLQLRQLDRVFSPQQIEIPSDPSLFVALPIHSDLPSGGDTGGCPFMAGKTAGTTHEEL